MGGTVTADQQQAYMAIPMAGLVGKEAVPFSLYLRTASNTWVLYRPAHTMIDESHLGRLTSEGIPNLFILDEDRGAYFMRVESELDTVLHDRTMSLDDRAGVLYGVATMVSDELLSAKLDRKSVLRARRVMMAMTGLLLREGQGFQAMRRMLTAGSGLSRHSLTVAFLSMGLARVVLSADAETLTMAGLAGMLHDVGRVGHEDLEHDPEHATRGSDFLRGLNLPVPVIEAAQSHHECFDGTGYPKGLRGKEIPELARIVGLVNLFDKVYNDQEPRVGVFDALRI
ncbi:MAG: putative nucleotidyltransferase with HDIG domain, partial [Planctomycetota bacterium]